MATRARTTSAAAGSSSSDWPLWMATVPRIVNDWLNWTDTRDQFLA